MRAYVLYTLDVEFMVQNDQQEMKIRFGRQTQSWSSDVTAGPMSCGYMGRSVAADQSTAPRQFVNVREGDVIDGFQES